MLALGPQGLVAGSLAHFNVAATINKALGARELAYGAMVAAMVLQLTNLPIRA